MQPAKTQHPLLEALKSLIEACFIASQHGLIDFADLDEALERHTGYSHLKPRQRRGRTHT